MTDPTNVFWDSCVFIRFLIGDTNAEHYWDIKQHIEDAKKGITIIHASTIVMAEVKPSHLTKSGYGDFNEFHRDLEGAVSFIDPTPDILQWCGVVRDFTYPNPNHTPKHPAKDKILGMADAIHLMTCVYAKEVMGVADITFHTMNDGKHKNAEGNCVTLLNFEKWTNGIPKNPHTPRIVALPRLLPLHSQPHFLHSQPETLN